MAIVEYRLKGNFDQILDMLHSGILNGSTSASFEGGSDFHIGDARCAVQVYERYSIMGGNRVSLNLTVFGNGDQLCISAITAGGSQAMLFKINTFGEEAFLDCVRDLLAEYAPL